MVQFHLKVSKCDQLGAGVDIVVGRTGKDLCPVAALVAFVKVRGSGSGPFFRDSAGVAITKERFVAETRRCLESAGLQQGDYAGHSFRIGAATTAAMVGISDSSIQMLGRWRSSAFLQYIRTPKEKVATLSASLVAQA